MIRSVSDGLSKGTDFLYTQFFSAVARSTALSPAEITEIARSTQLSESEVSAHHLTFQGTCPLALYGHSHSSIDRRVQVPLG